MLAGSLGSLLVVAACRPGSGASPDRSPAPTNALRYVALGDSYTIGTSVEPDERWPDRLVAALEEGDPGTPTLDFVANLAVNGYTSGNVMDRQMPDLDALRPQFASLLIGVNDVVQGVSAKRFEEQAARILDDLLRRLPANRIVVVSTPDYTVTPQGAAYGRPDVQAAGIVANNAILERLSVDRGIAWVDIHDLSLRAVDDPSLVAGDGLHPSGAQYALWVERIRPVVEALLRT